MEVTCKYNKVSSLWVTYFFFKGLSRTLTFPIKAQLKHVTQAFGLKCSGFGTLIKLHEAAKHLPPSPSLFAYSNFTAPGKRETHASCLQLKLLFQKKQSKWQEIKTLSTFMYLDLICYASQLGLPAPLSFVQTKDRGRWWHPCMSLLGNWGQMQSSALSWGSSFLHYWQTKTPSLLLTESNVFLFTYFFFFKASMGDQSKITGFLQTRTMRGGKPIKAYKL